MLGLIMLGLISYVIHAGLQKLRKFIIIFILGLE